MPIKVPNNLPAVETLTKENIFVMTDTRAMTQDIRPLKIIILNLMPTKIDTETQLTRLLGNTPLQVELELLQVSSHKAKNTSEEHMLTFYKTFSQVKSNFYDGMIITGAPVEHFAFEEVEYWDELCEIMEWSKSHVHNTFHICWGAQAGLYYHYGIQKYNLKEKISGIYTHQIETQGSMLFRGFDDVFMAPHSRNTEVRREDIVKVPQLEVISSSEEAGVYAVKSKNDRQIFIMGHSEYDSDTLLKEYIRDKNKGINPKIPDNYFPENDDEKQPIVTWRSSANLLYSNWLNYFVYQSTPYQIEQISTGDKRRPVIERGKLTTCKFGGTSLADGKAFRKVKDILSEDDRRRMIVVSAPGRRFKGDTKITDLLIAMSKEDGFTEESHELFSEIKRRFHTIEKDLGMQDVLSDEYEKIEFEIRNGATYPYIASRGEYLSAKLMADYLGWEFIAPEKYLKFDAQGIFQYEQSLELLKAALEDVERGVIPGFYGSDFSNKIVTFSRGGSDVTGALVAAACSADLYENWTDVSGLLMADPQIVPNPITVPVITYKELRELSYMGAAVMHPDAIKPVRQLCIPINIRNTNRPEDGGTLIVENADYYGIGDFITGITGTSNLMSILIEKENLNEDPHFRGEILHRLVNQGIRVNHTLSEIDSITLIIDKGQLSSIIDVKSMIEGILESYIKDVNVVVDPDLSIIAIVGRNIGTTPDVAVRVLNALSMRRINVKLIDHGPRRYNILIGVPQDNYKTSINAIYNNFIGHKL